MVGTLARVHSAEITSALFLLPVIRDRRCSICALDLVLHHLRALAIASPSPCLRNRAGLSQHQSTTAATESNQTSPWVLTRYDLCDATDEEQHAMAVVGASGGTTISKRRRWWWLQWKPGWVRRVRWCSHTSTASAVVVARMHAVDAVRNV